MAELKPIKLQYENGTEYVLEYNAQSVRDLEGAGFRYQEVGEMPVTMVTLLFHYAFTMHHPELTLADTDKILLTDLDGMTEEMRNRLIELYVAVGNGLVGDGKNAKAKVVL